MWAFEDGLVHIKGVYRDSLCSGVQDELCRRAVEERVVVVAGRAVVFLPAGADDSYDALREPRLVGPQVLDRDALPGPFTAHVHNDSRTEEEARVHLIYPLAALDEVVGGVDMGPGVAPDVDAQDVDAVGSNRGRGLEAHFRISRVNLGSLVNPAGEVDDAAYLYRHASP